MAFLINEEQYILPDSFSKAANENKTRSFVIARKPAKKNNNLKAETQNLIGHFFRRYPQGKDKRRRIISQFEELPFTEPSANRTYKAPEISIQQGWIFFYLSVRMEAKKGLTSNYSGIKESSVSKSWAKFSHNVFPSRFFLVSDFVSEKGNYLEKQKLDVQLGHLIVANQELYTSFMKTTGKLIEQCVLQMQEYFCEQVTHPKIVEEKKGDKKKNRVIKFVQKDDDDELERVENESTFKKKTKTCYFTSNNNSSSSKRTSLE